MSPHRRRLLAVGVAALALRVVLLVVAVPVVSYLIRKRIFIPWYLVLFVVVALVFSYAPLGAGISQGVINVYEVSFSAALASIGMNANVLHVFKRLFKPLVLVMLVFVVDLALWWFTHGLIHY